MTHIRTKIPKGFTEPIIEDSEYLFGDGQLTTPELQLSGQWEAYLPTEEKQDRQFETYNCTGFVTTSAVEMLLRRKYNRNENFSDRFLGKVAGTSRKGNTPHKSAEALRHYGFVNEERMPFGHYLRSIDEYYSYKRVNKQAILDEGEQSFKKYKFKHDWVLTKKTTKSLKKRQNLMMKALELSPLGVSVFAWIRDGEHYINPSKLAPGHFAVCFGYKKGEYWLIFDSYPPFIKKLEWNYPFDYVKRYSIETSPFSSNWFISLLKRLGII